MKILSYCSATIFAFIFMGSLTACFNGYDSTKPITESSSYRRVIERARKDKRYFIMHSGVDVYNIFSVEVERSRQQFTVQLHKVDSLHLANINTPKSLNEKFVHVFMRDSTSYTLDEPHTIPMNKVARIELAD